MNNYYFDIVYAKYLKAGGTDFTDGGKEEIGPIAKAMFIVMAEQEARLDRLQDDVADIVRGEPQ